MSFFAILFALLLEQVRPLARHNPIHGSLRSWARWSSRNFDAGKPQHGWIAWAVATVGPALAALAIHWALLLFVGWPAAVVWSVAVLYVTLGFRQFSHHFTAIRDALDAGEETVRASCWRNGSRSTPPSCRGARSSATSSSIRCWPRTATCSACSPGSRCWRHFGFGPAGAVLYRMSEFVTRYWRYRSQSRSQPASEALQLAATKAWAVIDWLPARITAMAFAIVGSFEEAIDCWRTHAQRFPNDNDGVVLAATSGAVNVRLGGEALRPPSRPTAPRPSARPPSLPRPRPIGHRKHARPRSRTRPPAQHRRPGVAVGGAVDGAAGAADAGSAAGVKADSRPRRLAQFGEQVAVDAVAVRRHRVFGVGVRDRRDHAAAGLVQVGAVVELAVAHVRAAGRASGRPAAWGRCGAARIPGSRASRSAPWCARRPPSTRWCWSWCACRS
jgi:adenosylcobinamide-phosphate synthase